jgi:hypothetical protein
MQNAEAAGKVTLSHPDAAPMRHQSDTKATIEPKQKAESRNAPNATPEPR